MVKKVKSGPIRAMPGRGALNDIAKSRKTINDYAKAVPTVQATPDPMEIMMLGMKKK